MLHNVITLSVCRDFLPRGSGIVTRRPLVLQLISSNAGGFAHILTPTHTHVTVHSAQAHTYTPPPSRHWNHSAFFLCISNSSIVFPPVRVGWVPPLQREEVHRLRRGPPGDRGGDGPRHGRQQGHIARPHQPAGVLPSRYGQNSSAFPRFNTFCWETETNCESSEIAGG